MTEPNRAREEVKHIPRNDDLPSTETGIFGYLIKAILNSEYGSNVDSRITKLRGQKGPLYKVVDNEIIREIDGLYNNDDPLPEDTDLWGLFVPDYLLGNKDDIYLNENLSPEDLKKAGKEGIIYLNGNLEGGNFKGANDHENFHYIVRKLRKDGFIGEISEKAEENLANVYAFEDKELAVKYLLTNYGKLKNLDKFENFSPRGLKNYNDGAWSN